MMKKKQIENFEKVNEQLAKILQSSPFKSSRVLTDFLKYIVSETLEGKEQFLKEYVIATSVLGRDPDFNPQLDAIVRIHAGRLRNQLEKYYALEGKNEPIKISIPKGRYIPVFENNFQSNDPILQSELIKPTGSKPKIAVLPFASLNPNKKVEVICSVLSRDLSIEFSKFQEFNVISNFSIQLASAQPNGLDKLISHLDPDYVMMGTCRIEGENLSVGIELHAMRTNQLIWAESFIIKDYLSNNLSQYKDLIQKSLAITCGYFGIIYRHSLTIDIPQDSTYLHAIYWHNKVHQDFTKESFTEAFKAIDLGLEKNPESSILYSIKAELILNLKTIDAQGDIDVVDEGMKLALRALSLDNNNQHAWQELAWANLFAHNQAKSIQTLQKCLSINPNNSMYISSVGFGFICAAEYEDGFELMSSAIQNPYYFWITNAGLCMYYIRNENFDEALYWAKIIKKPKMLWDPILRLASLGWLGRKEEAQPVILELLDLCPSFKKRAEEIIDTFLIDKDLQSMILKGMEMAGVELDVIKGFTGK
jgi:TolB-like protein